MKPKNSEVSVPARYGFLALLQNGRRALLDRLRCVSGLSTGFVNHFIDFYSSVPSRFH